MALPLRPPLAPQLARSARALPEGEGWVYEEKLDGFRVIVFVDRDDVVLQSRGGRPLGRYFPEIIVPPGCYVLDGEIVVRRGGRPDFEALQQRIHPAASRVARLAAEIPAELVAFDLLALDDAPWLDRPFAERRAGLERHLGGVAPIAAQEADPGAAARWLGSAEGVVAKDLAAPYLPGRRAGMVKVKRLRTIDAVVVGYRHGVEPGTVGALILGLYDPAGELRVVGHSSGFGRGQKAELPALLAPYESGRSGGGEPGRWSRGRDPGWVGLSPDLVAEVSFDHMSGGRIRHGARFLRWRTDRDPLTCRTDQVDEAHG